MAKEEICITGFSARFSQADNLREFKEKLYAGVDFVTDDEARWPRGYLSLPERMGKIRDVSLFDAQFFGVHEKQAHQMDPQMRLLLETSYEAIFDAGYDPATLRGRKVGVFVGCGDSESGDALCLDAEKVDGYGLLGNSRALFSNRLSYTFDFHGPSMSVDTACSSTITALNEAVQALRCGQCEAAVVAGCMVGLKPTTALGFQRLGMLSPDGKCKAFDSRGNGFVRSETVGSLFLQRMSEARRVYAKVIHVNASADGYKIQGITYPSAKAQEQLLRDTYREANVDPRCIDYVEAHGTGTKAGDLHEMEAIAKVFCEPRREKALKVGAVKSNVGHAETASGISSIAKVILAMETGTIAGNLHFEHPNPSIPSLHDGSVEVVANNTAFSGGKVGLNSFGMGGASAHVILESNQGPHVDSILLESPELPRLVLLSGRSEEALKCTLDRMEAEGLYPDSVYALMNRVGQLNVQQFPYRGFTVVPVDGSSKDTVKVIEKAPTEKRPLWFVFTGMGCQWKGMARQMMQFQAFAQSIRKLSDVLKQFDMDLIEILTTENGSPNSFASVLASIAAVQVALVDVLCAVGIQPDGLLGHSLGEIVCGYADGCLTAEQSVLCAYWRGRCVDEGNLPFGAMAAIGLTWQEAANRCRDGVEPACHNAGDSVTVSGPASAVAELVKELKGEGVFAREVDCMNVAFHSKYIQSIREPLRYALQKVVPDPKRRSARWISSSVPASRWHEPLAELCSAEYEVNNLLSPVLFQEALQHVPPDAVVVEIAPHCLLQPILRRSLASGATCLGLMKRDADNLTYFLNSLGKLHTLGAKLDVSSLYPPVPFPVPRGTPPISHLVCWDHSKRWTVVKWSDFASSGQSAEDVVEVDVEANERDAYLAGHRVDGRIIFPAAGYLVLAWKYLAKRSGRPLQAFPVIFEDVLFHRAIILPKSGPVRFLVSVMRTSGEFEICEAGKVAASGRIRVVVDGEVVLEKEPPGPSSQDVAFELDTNDIYKDLRLRGYDYKGEFQSILEADLKGSYGTIKWDDNWVTFIDNMLQLRILGDHRRDLRLIVKIQSCRVEPQLHARMAGESGGKGLHAVYDHHLNECRAGGVAIRGIKLTTAPRRAEEQVPHLDEYKFVPYTDDESAERKRESHVREYCDVCTAITGRIIEIGRKNGTEIAELVKYGCKTSSQIVSRYLESPAENHILLRVLADVEKNMCSDALTLASAVQSALATRVNDLAKDILNTALFEEDPLRNLLDVVVENSSSKRIRFLELAGKESELLLAPLVCSLLPLSHTLLKTEYTIAHPCPQRLAAEQVPDCAKTAVWDTGYACSAYLSDADLIVLRDVPHERKHLEALAKQLSENCDERAFILLAHRVALTPAEMFLSALGKVPLSHHGRGTVESLFGAVGFGLVGRKCNNLSTVLLLRKTNSAAKSTIQDVVRVNNSTFDWVETLKQNVLNCESNPTGQNIWLLSDESCGSGVVGLMNCLRLERGVSRIRCLSSNSSSLLPESLLSEEILEKDLVMNIYQDGKWGSYRYLTTHQRGDLEKNTEYAFLHVKTRGDLSTLQWYESSLSCATPVSNHGKVLCSVYYAPLNFHDIMLATGKITADALLDDEDTPECLIGVEFSGRDPDGRRVMGMAAAEAMATMVAVDPDFLWEVPDAWTLEEASTVPVAYCTAYYALVVRGNMLPGETLLVHSGSGGVGQAAITIALSMGCTVFTTVGSKEKRDFLKRRFPQLVDRNFATSRDLSFEEHILRETEGRGVDLVLNSLSGEKLQASLRCLASHGRFLELGKFDLAKDSMLAMSVFLKRVTFSGIHLEAVRGKCPSALQEQRRVTELLRDGVTSGVVQPLDTIRFSRDQAEEAFRFMSSGKHIGKVVLQIRPEEFGREIVQAAPLVVEAVAHTWFHEHKSYIIVGGLGGFGLELAGWMVSRGCRKLLLSSRSGLRTGYQKLCLRWWKQAGVEVILSQADASTKDGAQQLIKDASAIGPIGGIFNLALVLRDALLENQSAELFEAVCTVKVDGTRHLDELSRKSCPELDHFVAFSSSVSGHGNVGQTGYGYANSAMERICERRIMNGMPGLAIQWGAVGDVGFLGEGKSAYVGLAGYAAQRISSCLNVLDRFLNQGKPVVLSLVKAGEPTNTDQMKSRYRDIVLKIAHIFGVKDAGSLDENTTLGALGMDSLIGIEVQQTLERDYDVFLSAAEIRRLTIKRLRQIEDGASNRGSAAGTTVDARPSQRPAYESAIPRLKLAEKLIPDCVFVEMNSLNGSTPLFVMHTIQGDVNPLLELAEHLPVRAVGLQRSAEIPVLSVEEMAAIYTRKMSQVQPAGPYHLVGYSYGATLAFEVALQLQASGASMGSLTLLDGAPGYIPALWSHHESRLEGTEQDAETSLICTFLLQYADVDVLEVRDQMRQCTSWHAMVEVAIDILLRAIPDVKISRQGLAKAMRAFHDLVKAGSNYQPRGKFSGDVVLVKASRPRAMAKQLPPDYGLSEFVRGKVEVEVVDGSHEEFIIGRGARECAAIISRQVLP